MRRKLLIGLTIVLLIGVTMWLIPAQAQQPAPPPSWKQGQPAGMAESMLAPIAQPPAPKAPGEIPVDKIKLPPGFKAEVYQAGVLDARGMREGDKGTVFVSSLFVAGKIYAITNQGGKRELKTIAEKLFLPNGIEFNKGSLYVATPKDITRYDNIEANLDNPPKPVMVYDKLPGEVPHGWKFIKIGPDGKLYVPIGAPCNICEPDRNVFTRIIRMNLDGSNVETVAKGRAGAWKELYSAAKQHVRA